MAQAAQQQEMTFEQRYTVLRRIGAGGMAEVFLAQSHVADQPELVCIKRMLSEAANEDPEMAALFAEEANLGRFLRHPNIVRVYETHLDASNSYIVMEYIDGPSLHTLMHAVVQAGAQFPIEVAAEIACGMCLGLQYVHGMQSSGHLMDVVVRDVCPNNVMIGLDGRVKLVDFGIARHVLRRRHTETGMIRGHLNYLSPEQLTSAPIDARSDQYATAVTLWEMLTGQSLFGNKTDVEAIDLILDGKVPKPQSVRKDIPKVLQTAILKALSKKIRTRFASMAQFESCIAPFKAHEPGRHVAAWVAKHNDRCDSQQSGPSFTAAVDNMVPKVLQCFRENPDLVPALPGFVVQAMDLAGRIVEADLTEILEVVQRDQPTVARLIKATNSALHNPAIPQTALGDSIVRLGRSEVGRIILAVTSRFLFNLEARRIRQQHPAIWYRLQHHAVTCAFACARLSERYGIENSHDAFLAGMFHDVGKVFALTAITSLALKGKLQATGPECEAVMQHMHGDLGREAIARWELPAFLQDICGTHHDDDLGPDERLIHLVAVVARVNETLDSPCVGVATWGGIDGSLGILKLQMSEIEASVAEARPKAAELLGTDE